MMGQGAVEEPTVQLPVTVVLCSWLLCLDKDRTMEFTGRIKLTRHQFPKLFMVPEKTCTLVNVVLQLYSLIISYRL